MKFDTGTVKSSIMESSSVWISSIVSLALNIVFWTDFFARDLGKYTIAGVCLTPRTYFREVVSKNLNILKNFLLAFVHSGCSVPSWPITWMRICSGFL